MDKASAERREVVYSGRVQGVGFRYTVRQIATFFPVTGFVKNLPNQRVQLIAEGADDALQRFLAAIDAELERHIAGRQENRSEATGRFDGFTIRF